MLTHSLLLVSNQRPRFLPLTKSEVEKLQALKSVDRVSGLQELMNLRDHVFEEDKAELKARGVLERKGLSNAQCTELIPLLLDPTKCTTKYGSHSLDYEIRAPVMLLTLSDISSIKARSVHLSDAVYVMVLTMLLAETGPLETFCPTTLLGV